MGRLENPWRWFDHGQIAKEKGRLSYKATSQAALAVLNHTRNTNV